MTKELRDLLIGICGLESDVKDRWLELTYPSLIAAYKAGYSQAEKDNAPQWHYPSKGELPEMSKRVLVKAKYQEDVYVGEVFSPDAFTVAHKRWVLYTDDGDYYYSDKEIIAWQYIELPKEM